MPLKLKRQPKFLRRNLPIDVLAYSQYQQLRIEIVGDQSAPVPIEPHSAIMLIIDRKRLSDAVAYRCTSDPFPSHRMNDVGRRQFLQAL